MTVALRALGSLLTLCALSAGAAGQSGSAPAGGTSAGPAGGAGSGVPPITTHDLDLPLEEPVYQPAPTPPPPAPPAPQPPRDDPRDAPPPTIYGEEIVSENDTLVYVLDRSGSMAWDTNSYLGLDGAVRAGPRMERAKVEITRSILGLSANFRFNVVAFDCSLMQWRAGLVPADEANKQAALAWIAALTPGGGTGTGPATALGLAARENQLVVLLTDGAPNCGVPEFDMFSWYGSEEGWIGAHRRMIRTANVQGARINVFGIAAAGLYRQFCQQVAADSAGSYTDVP